MSRILYAEDEFTNRKLMDIQFKNKGVPCDLACSGQEALDLYRKNHYDLIILDQYMPGYNGDDLARIIRQEDAEIPLIAITSDDETITTLKMAGFNEVFIKPLRGTKHMEIIQSYLKKNQDN